MAGMAAPHKAVDEDSDLSHLEGDSVEELGVQDPVSVGLNAELLFPLSIGEQENFYSSVQVQGCITMVWGCPHTVCCSHESCFGFQELEAIKARVREMEKEDERLKALQLEAESRLIMSSEAGTGCPWSQAGMGLMQVIPTCTSHLCQPAEMH